MRHTSDEPIFENRYDAGRKLAEKLTEYANKSAVVLGYTQRRRGCSA